MPANQKAWGEQGDTSGEQSNYAEVLWCEDPGEEGQREKTDNTARQSSGRVQTDGPTRAH
mgnify:CR=1 FL=1